MQLFMTLHTPFNSAVWRIKVPLIQASLTETIKKACNAGLYTSVLAVDISQFFPSLNHQAILDILEKEGLSPILTNLLRSYYADWSTKYRWNAFYSKDYDINNGVPQGDPLSPIISAIYNSALSHLLFPLDPSMQLNCSSYIDDFILIVTSSQLDDNVDRLENAYLALAKALHKIGLQIEPSKTELMHFAAKNIHAKRGRKPITISTSLFSPPSCRTTPYYQKRPNSYYPSFQRMEIFRFLF